MHVSLSVFSDYFSIRYNDKLSFVKQINFLEGQLKPDDRVILKILGNGDFWAMWDRGVGYYDVYNNKWNQISDIQLGHYSWFTSMDIDKGGNAWVGTVQDGIYTIDMHNFSVTHTYDLPLLSLNSYVHAFIIYNFLLIGYF